MRNSHIKDQGGTFYNMFCMKISPTIKTNFRVISLEMNTIFVCGLRLLMWPTLTFSKVKKY